MFGNASKPSRIYSFGAKPPAVNLDLVDRQIGLAHKYKNDLVALERRRREAVAAALMAHCPGLEASEALVAALVECLTARQTEIAARNARARRRVATKEDRAFLADLKQSLADARASHKEQRQEVFAAEGWQEAQARIDAATAAEARELRAACNLYWGSYLSVEQTMQGCRTGPPPEFRTWDGGSGRVAVQIQGGMSVAELLSGADTRLQVVPLPDALRGSGRFPLTAAKWHLCRVRVGSEGRAPVWAEVPFALHRPFPEGCRIKWAYLVRHRDTPQDQRRLRWRDNPRRVHVDRWEVQFVIEDEEGFVKPGRATSGRVGLDVGWRLVDGGLRVAYWHGDDGRHGQLLVPEQDLKRWTKSRELQATRDDNFNVARERLATWLDGREWLPQWLQEDAAQLRNWKSLRRLAALALTWRDGWTDRDGVRHEGRFDGDAEALSDLLAWRGQDLHLWAWQTANLAKAQNWREHLYRNLAVQLAREYRTVAVEDTDWRDLARRPGPENEDGQQQARLWRTVAASGRLLEIMREALTETVPFPAAYTTQFCHVCWQPEAFDAAAELAHRCSHCGHEWDQDDNAAQVLLGMLQGREPPASAAA